MFRRIRCRDCGRVDEREGHAAEAHVLRALIDRGLHVLIPFGDGHPYDLVIHVPGHRSSFVSSAKPRGAQLTAAYSSTGRTTDHGRGRREYFGLADVFGVYASATGEVYLVPVAELTGYVGRLRLEATRNNQRAGIRMAADYQIDRWTDDALRRLGSRIAA